MRQALITTIALLLMALGCQPKPQAYEAPATQPPDMPASQPSETPAVMPEMEMIEPAATFSVIQVSTDTVSIPHRPSTSQCPHLESRLYDLTMADDAAVFAQSSGLFYEDNATRVVIELVTSDTSISFLVEYDAQIETQTGSLVQALVPLERLCDLSNNPQVRFVREPYTAIAP